MGDVSHSLAHGCVPGERNYVTDPGLLPLFQAVVELTKVIVEPYSRVGTLNESPAQRRWALFRNPAMHFLVARLSNGWMDQAECS